jgi:CheY-like chemotaxis protein
MTAGSEFVPVVDDHLVNRLAAVPSLERDKHRVRAVANRLQGLKARLATSCSTARRWTS